MERIKKRIGNLSMFRKIFFTLVFLMAVVCIIYLMNLQHLVEQYNTRLYQVTARSLRTATSSMEEELRKIATLSTDTAMDKVIQEKIPIMKDMEQTSKQGTARREIYETMYQYYYRNEYVTSIALYLDDTVIRMGEKDSISDSEYESLREKAVEAQGRIVWQYDESNANKIACVRQVRETKDLRLTDLGILFIYVDLESLVIDCLDEAGYSEEEGEFALFDSRDTTIYTQRDVSDDLYQKIVRHEDNSYLIEKVGDTEEFIISGQMFNGNNWKYVYFQDYNQLFEKMNQIKVTTVLITVLVCVLAVMAAQIVLSSIFRHMDFLIEKIEAFGSGKAIDSRKFPNYSERGDEIGKLHQAFDEMTYSVKRLRDENYDKQILLREAEIKMLEQQINPHFLYNTLDSINWMAQCYHADDISQMARSLGNIFRISISEKRELILLDEELSLLDNYIQIQKIRFKDKLEFQIIKPDGMDELYIPKLCIQPLVENALKYALECNDEVCVIQVLIKKEEKYYRIQISNTGSEFDQDLLEKLKQHIVIPQGTGVGIMNIDSRLRLIYGTDYGLRFRNEDGKAIVELRIPFAKSGKAERDEGNAAFNDCG